MRKKYKLTYYVTAWSTGNIWYQNGKWVKDPSRGDGGYGSDSFHHNKKDAWRSARQLESLLYDVGIMPDIEIMRMAIKKGRRHSAFWRLTA